MAATVNGLNYTSPFEYRVFTAQLWPSYAVRVAPFTLTLTPQLTGGSWQTDSASGGIAALGSSITVGASWQQTTVQFTGEAHHTASGALPGSFAGLSLDLFTRIASFDAGGGVRSWKTPLDQEWGYNAYVSRGLGQTARVDVQVARSVTDPVLATPGSFGASLSLSWRVAVQHSKALTRPVASMGLRTPQGRKVRFTLDANASSAAVSGSFTDWNPVAMQRKGKTFSVELLVPTGTHQYGFLLDGTTWYLPTGVSGVVDDGFGRKNATLVVD